MPRSEAYARIKADVYAVASAIPEGRLTTFAAIGAFLDVVPRQVAFLLALRNDVDREACPWYRVVSETGAFGRPKYDAHGRSQRHLLEAEGITCDARGVADFASRMLFTPTTRNTGVRPTPRPTAGVDGAAHSGRTHRRGGTHGRK